MRTGLSPQWLVENPEWAATLFEVIQTGDEETNRASGRR